MAKNSHKLNVFFQVLSVRVFRFFIGMYREQKKLILDTFFVPQNTRIDRFFSFRPIFSLEKKYEFTLTAISFYCTKLIIFWEIAVLVRNDGIGKLRQLKH